MRKTIIVVGAILMAAAGATVAIADEAALGDTGTIPACEHEDGSTQDACHWDAGARGNGKGRSYISFDYGDSVIYLTTT